MKKLAAIIPFALLLPLGAALTSCGGNNGYSIEKVSNEGGSAFYEIFVGSFADSNGDGTGDLNGITSKLDYLADLGVSNIWLTPIHPSPSYHKYDVKDYYAIDPKFGTLDDFDNLIAKANEHHINIIMDMVFNHASTKSTWFQNFCKAMNGEDGYDEYKADFSWSRNAQEGYQYNAEAGAYVECRFSESMPEFNLDTPHVREEQKRIQKFWLDRGVKGFRYDAVLYFYYNDSVQNAAYMSELVSYCRSVRSDAYLVGEAWVNAKTGIESYASSGMNCFNFPTSENNQTGSIGNVGTSTGLTAFGSVLQNTQEGLASVSDKVQPCYFISNHDQDRWAKYDSGKKNEDYRRKLMTSCYLLTPGTPFMYYGEEIGLCGVRKNESSDAARRQAMQWGEGNDCAQPEKFVYKDQTTNTVASAKNDGWSMLNHEKKVLSVRNKYNDVFQNGTYTYQAFEGTNNAILLSIAKGNETYYLVHSNLNTAQNVELPQNATLLEDINTFHVDSTLSGKSLTIQPYSSVLLKVN